MDDAFTALVFELFQSHGALIRFGDAFTKTRGLSSASWQVLGAIARGEGARTVPQIARRMGQARQSVQRQTNILLEKGLVEFVDNPDHKRSPLVALTLEGSRVQDELNEEWREHIREWTESIRPVEAELARDVVVRLRELITPE